MPSNVEIKAKLENLESFKAKASQLSDSDGELIEQEDTFFPVRQGRLKLRKFKDGSGELIFYERPDVKGPKVSEYSKSTISNASDLQETLSKAFGVQAVVKKQRWLYMVGQTRVHADRVEDLGDFMELEVVLKEGQSAEDGDQIAQELLKKLDVPESSLLSGAYMDLLRS